MVVGDTPFVGWSCISNYSPFMWSIFSVNLENIFLMSDYIDTRDLITRRDELKEEIFDDFIEQFEQYSDMTDSFEDIRLEGEEVQDWKQRWEDELLEINEIDEIENTVTDFEYGETLIAEDCFEDYTREFCEDVGYIKKDHPWWIEIDWVATSANMAQDYSMVRYRSIYYYVRS